MEQNSAFGWLNHRADCKKVSVEIRSKIKLVGLKCLADAARCKFCCAGLGMLLHLKDEHGIDLRYYEDDFAQFYQARGVVQILAEEEAKALPQIDGLQLQFELSEQWNTERLKRLNEARLRVIETEGEDLASRRTREFLEYMDIYRSEHSKMEHHWRMQLLREKEDACAAALAAEQLQTAKHKQLLASVLSEVQASFQKTSELIACNDTAAANEHVQLLASKLQQQSECAKELSRIECAEFMMQAKADVEGLREQLARLKDIKTTVMKIINRINAVRNSSRSAAEFSALQNHNVSADERLGLYSDTVIKHFGQRDYGMSMTTDDIMARERKYYQDKRKAKKVWVPSYQWVVECQMFCKDNAHYRALRQAFEVFDHCMKCKSSVRFSRCF
jgi:hypothetical protein